MGPIGMPEIVMIFVILVILAVPVIIAIAIIWYFTSRGKASQSAARPTSVQERLQELDALRAKNLISEAEHEERRKQIINGI